MADRLQVLIKIHICGEGHICVMSRLEVGHTAGRYAETPQHWKVNVTNHWFMFREGATSARWGYLHDCTLLSCVNESNACGSMCDKSRSYDRNANSKYLKCIWATASYPGLHCVLLSAIMWWSLCMRAQWMNCSVNEKDRQDDHDHLRTTEWPGINTEESWVSFAGLKMQTITCG